MVDLNDIAGISYQDCRRALLEKAEIALLDVRDEADFAQGHPLFAANFPLSRIEADVAVRIPRRNTTLAIYDNGEGLASEAARHLVQLGYTAVHLLDGGLQGWRDAGGEIFIDVNTPSKAFGELVESQRHTPSLSAQEVQALIAANADIVILDARRFDEYNTMSIPRGVSVPGAELVLRARELAPRPETRIIVNCAGRTRSIIGAQSLINAQIPNPVSALRNGTIGWTLAGQTLETGRIRTFAYAGPVAGEHLEAAQKTSRALADRTGVTRIGTEILHAWRDDASRTTYLFDVRTPEEHAAGHVPDFRSAPGGQLVQETDHHAPVRGARIVLADDDGVRANMTGSWLAQMGWQVAVVDGLDAKDFHDRSAAKKSDAGAHNGKRYRRPYEGTDNPHARMQAYLDWEYGLVDQLARDGTHGFFVA